MDPGLIQIQSGPRIRIQNPDPGGKKSRKNKKLKKDLHWACKNVPVPNLQL